MRLPAKNIQIHDNWPEDPPKQPESFALPHHALVPSTIDPRQPPPHAAATPVWAGGSASATPARDPSSRTPAHVSEDRPPQPTSFPKNAYIASSLIPDDLCIQVVIHNTTQPPRWEKGRFESSLAVWPKRNNRDPGRAHILISGVTYSLPERNVRPHHPTAKGPVIVIDAVHPRYGQCMVITLVKKGGNCMVRPKGDHSRAKLNQNRFEFPPTSLAVVVGCQDW
ncbi:hypothetical protein H0H92_006238 [Tricholoma furcatifolium]|nr:hypothetical protein H0H92_006238 [Tricholoma furcatifolium]